MSSDGVMAPEKIILHKISRTLEVIFADCGALVFPAALLRSCSPSAENRTSTKTPADFAGVSILSVEPVGHYAVKLLFSDGHRSGIFTWEMLRATAESIQHQNRG